MSWGGARANAGRPAKGPVPSEAHARRPRFAARHPVHVTARLALLALPRGLIHRALRRALGLSLARADFRIVHLAVHARRLELVVEAQDMATLARGMQGFEVSAARSLNRKARRRGNVFPDRYRMRVLATRAAVRGVLGALGSSHRHAWPETVLLVDELERTTARTRDAGAG